MGNTVWKTTQLVALVCALLAKPVLAGTNAGFSVVVDPAEIRGPAVGERIARERDLIIGPVRV